VSATSVDQTVGIAGRREDPLEPQEPSGEASNGETVATPAARLRIGKYEIVRLLGRGGMGAVYQALDPVLEREVALKVMLPETAGDPEQKQRFEREARAVARLSHPSVVTVFDLGYHTDGSPYIVMELLRGQDLLARVRKEPPLSLKEKLTIVAQVLDGLGHAHKAGIVHRDVKPANVFLTDEGSARIMDFGIAFFTSSAATSRSVLGTVGYMSPEQVRGERVDGRSDLFSVGSLLCELLTGRRPFDAETPMATFYRIARGQAAIELPPGPEHAAVLPVLRRALAVSLEERYATAAEFAAALRACLDGGAPATRPDRAHATPDAPREAPSLRAPGVAAGVEATPAPKRVDTRARRADPSGLFRLLREIYVGSKSGHLHLALAGERKSLRILRGQIVHGTSDTAGEHLGDILVRYGLLSQADLERAVVIVLRERRRLGAVLGELGLLERSRIEEAVGLHAREILFSVLGRSDVSCTFEDLAESLIETDLVCPLSTGQLILEATRRVLDPDLVRTVLGDLGRVLTLSSDPLLRSQRITLTPADGFLLSRVDGNLTAREVIGLVPLAVEDAERSLFSLLCTGIVDYRQGTSSTSRAAARPTTPPTPRPTPAVTPPPQVVTPPPAVATPRQAVVVPPPAAPTPLGSRAATPATPTNGGPSAPAAPPEDEHRRSVARRVEEIRALILDTYDIIKRDHFEVLGLERTATESDVREAYASFARVLHPDACRYPELADLREKREAVFIRLSQAFETLRNPELRAAYERAYEPSKLRLPKRARPQAAPLAAPPTPPPAAATPPPSPLTPPPAPATASPGPTPAAAPENGAPASASRAAATDAAPPAVDVRLTPEHILASAERLFQDEKYWDTIQQLEPIIPRAAGPTRARAMMLLAQVYMKNPLWKKRSEGVLQSLVHENPRHVVAHLLLADLYRSNRLPTRARSIYRKVLEIEPGNEEASRALAFLEQQEETAPPPSGFAAFFKKR
jgi:serine/threonine protein kinase